MLKNTLPTNISSHHHYLQRPYVLLIVMVLHAEAYSETPRVMIFELLSLASIFLILTSLVASEIPSYCFKNGNNYTSNSIYKSNLDALFLSLSTSVDDNGFYNASMGKNPDVVYANVLCRGDVQLDICRGCIQNATVEIVNSCPNYKQAVLYNEFCTLRYSNESMFRILMPSDTQVSSWSMQNVSRPEEFMADLRTLVDVIRSQASSGGSLRKVAAGNKATVNFQNIFSLVQCTPDLSPEDCSSCLVASSGNIPFFCDRRRGCRIHQPNCNLRYEDVPFYNETRLRELQALITTPQLQLPPSSSQPTPSPPPGKKDATKIIVIIVVSIIGCLILAVGTRYLWTKKKPIENLESAQGINMVESLQYDFYEIKAATDDFSDANMLGQGGFGVVYKGILPNGQEIAVKRLSIESKQGDVEFKNEVLLVAKLQHRNLVRLLGFCIESKERLLIYEFIKNASLDKFIFDPRKRSDLDSEIRYKIVKGIAKGLLYLHEESRLKIIHRDLKAGNILLDGDMNPKISDFGTARLFVTDETQANTNIIVGTPGYMAPEYAMYGDLSVKSDVFSFGVLVLEIVSGQRNTSYQNGEDMENLLSLAWKSWRQRMAENVIDPVLRTSSSTIHDMLRCIHIGLLCVQENPVDRPTMAEVVVMLSSFTISLPIPTHFPVHGYNSSDVNSQGSDLNEALTSKSSSWNKSTQSSESSKNEGSSKNKMSITEFYPR